MTSPEIENGIDIPHPIPYPTPYILTLPQGAPFMLKLLAAGITLFGLMALAAAFAQSGRAEPALSRTASVLPPP